VAESKTVSATAAGVAVTATATVVVVAGEASQLSFSAQPQNAQVLATLSPPVAVAARDAFGNLVTGFTGTVTIAIGHDGSLLQNAALGGTTAVAAVLGVASFDDLTIDQVGSDYTLVAAASGLAGATSAAFAITLLP
jgi:hypothetical protein